MFFLRQESSLSPKKTCDWVLLRIVHKGEVFKFTFTFPMSHRWAYLSSFKRRDTHDVHGVTQTKQKLPCTNNYVAELNSNSPLLPFLLITLIMKVIQNVQWLWNVRPHLQMKPGHFPMHTKTEAFMQVCFAPYILPQKTIVIVHLPRFQS